MSENEINIIAPVGIIIGGIVFYYFNNQVVTVGRFLLSIWNTFTY